MRAYYLLGSRKPCRRTVTLTGQDQATVLKQGAFVRARREFTVPMFTAGGRNGTPEEQVRGASKAPLIRRPEPPA